MFRNQYDSDVSIWSPQGKLHQIDYAIEAVSQGACILALKSKSIALLVSLRKRANELSSYQKKNFRIDDNIGMSISGLSSDARIIYKLLRREALNHKYVFSSGVEIDELLDVLVEHSHNNISSAKRAFGVGLLVAGFSEQAGPQIFQFCPSGNVYGCKAMAIGSRSQLTRTYLEQHMADFEKCELNGLVNHGLLALRESLPGSISLSSQNVEIGIVGKDIPFREMTGQELDSFISAMPALL